MENFIENIYNTDKIQEALNILANNFDGAKIFALSFVTFYFSCQT